MTVGELLSRMSSSELTDWMAYAELEPFGEERADLRAAIIASTIANAQRDPKKKPLPYKAADFMPKFGPPTRKSPADLLAKAHMINAMFGGRNLKDS